MKIRVLVPVWAVSLSSLALAQAPLYDIPGTPGGGVHGLSAIRDLDGDGVNDLLVGSKFGDGLVADSGIVRVISGKTSQAILTLKGEHTNDFFGSSVAALEDITGDGKDEVIVGAPGYDSSNQDAGAAYVFSGATGALLTKIVGIGADDEFGHCVCAIGDYNLDGKADFAVGAPKGWDLSIFSNGGYVYVYSGATFFKLNALGGGFDGGQNFEDFGTSIARVGDLNGDGRDEFTIGAPSYDTSTSLVDSGRASVHAGGTGNILFNVKGTQAGEELGTSVAGIADVNGDGKNEFATGAPHYNTFALQEAGRTRVFSGSNGALLRTFLGGAAYDVLGYAIAGLDDFDGDGRGDIAIGSYGYDNGPVSAAGKVEVYSVNSGLLLTAWPGYESLSAMGFAVASAGDLNNDGATEVIGAAPTGNTYVLGGGHARVHLGQALTPESFCVAKTNSLGCVPGITYGGAASLTLGAGLGILGVNVIPGQNGLLIWSLTSASTPFFGGTLCVGGNIVRTSVQTTTINNGYPCTGQYYYQFGAAYMTTQGLTAGLDVYSQYWSRDSGYAAPNNIGLTNGLHFRIVP